MKTREQLLKEQAEQLRAFDLEVELTKSLPIPPDSFCGATWNAPYITYKNKAKHFPNDVYSLEEALGIIEHYKPYMVECEARKAGCTSILPPAIQKKEYLEGEFRFDSTVTLCIEGGEGYNKTKLQFYVLVGEKHFRVSIELQRKPKWSPSIRKEYYTSNDYQWIISPSGFGADHFIKWSAGDGSRRTSAHHITYHWETLDSFLTWAETQK